MIYQLNAQIYLIYIFLFADNTILSTLLKLNGDKLRLQDALTNLNTLSNIWLLSINILKM